MEECSRLSGGVQTPCGVKEAALSMYHKESGA